MISITGRLLGLVRGVAECRERWFAGGLALEVETAWAPGRLRGAGRKLLLADSVESSAPPSTCVADGAADRDAVESSGMDAAVAKFSKATASSSSPPANASTDESDTPDAPHEPAALAAWLARRGVNCAGWGVGEAKTVAQLAAELREGSCDIKAGSPSEPPVRWTSVAKARVLRESSTGGAGGEAKAWELWEVTQTLTDQRVRLRNKRGVSAKMRRGETPIAAARRGVLEEIALPASEASDEREAAARITVQEATRSWSKQGRPDMYAQLPGLGCPHFCG